MLKCLNGDQEVLSFQLDEKGWDLLRQQNQQERHLQMSCCDARVVLKRSKLNVPFFAHLKRGLCTSAAETSEHLAAKFLIATAIESAGWRVTTEMKGLAPNGAVWIADVYATKNDWIRVFEVQWSRQSNEESIARHSIYKQSGVRTMWLFRQKEFELPSEIPAFRLIHRSENSFCVEIETESGEEHIELQRFVKGALSGALKYAPTMNALLPLEVWIAKMDCFKCKRTPNIVAEFRILASRNLPGHRDLTFSFEDLSSSSVAETLAQQLLPNASVLQKARIGPVKMRYSKTLRISYLSNACAYCGVLFGQFFSHHAYDHVSGFESTVDISKNLVDAIDSLEHQVNVWWFNTSR